MAATLNAIIDRQLELVDAGMRHEEIRNVAKTIRAVHKANPAARMNPCKSDEVIRAALEAAQDRLRISPEITILIREFSDMYHLYFAQNEAMFQTNEFKINMRIVMPDIPEVELAYALHKITTLTNYLSVEDAAIVYEDILNRVREGNITPKNVEKLHGIINDYINSHYCQDDEGTCANILRAWALLDELPEEIMHDLRTTIASQRALSVKPQEIVKNMETLLYGIKNRNITEVLRGLSCLALLTNDKKQKYLDAMDEIQDTQN